MATARGITIRGRGRGGAVGGGWNCRRIGIWRRTTRIGEGFGPRKNLAVRDARDVWPEVVVVEGAVAEGAVVEGAVMEGAVVRLLGSMSISIVVGLVTVEWSGCLW